MQPFRPYLNGYYDAGNQLAEHIKGRIIQATAQEGLIKEGLKSVEEFEARRCRVKEAFLRALGGLPDGTHPLRARVTGVVERPHFRIEKVIFESLPGFPVTSNLYLPKDLDSPRPAVLFLCGHSREA
ncbi:MAG: hypothetical protein GX030_00935 [Firmicutes bacterium]|nr:hypothetical protein [Bacillota bacterium]